jgi:heat shock protein HslJ
MTHPARAGGRTRLATTVATLLLMLSVAACGSSDATASPQPSGPLDLDDTVWLLVSYLSPEGTSYTVPSAVTPTLAFADGTASGSGGCNTFSSPYELTGEDLTMGPVASTKIACEEPIASVENAYFAALDVVNKAAMLDTGRLQLWDSGGKTTLVFVPGS